MPYINSTKFGEVVIDSKKYSQVLIVGEAVLEREFGKLERLFGTTHRIGDWEIKELLKGEPEIVVVGTGQDGILQGDHGFLDAMQEKGIEVIAAKTPQAITVFNQKVRGGRRVNALIHTTC